MPPTTIQQLRRSFKDVSMEGDAIDIKTFLEATEGLLQVLESLGSAFGPVKSDISGNITKIRQHTSSSPDVPKTLQAMVVHERAQKKKTATEALLWLKRALEFASKGLRLNIADPSSELSTSFQKAYEGTLSPFHNFLIRPVFSLAMKACPKRSDFYSSLANGEPEAVLMAQLEEWLASLEKIVAILAVFYVTGGHDKV